MGLLRIFVFTVAASTVWSAPAFAIMALCRDGTSVGPLLPDNACEGHGGFQGGGQTSAPPTQPGSVHCYHENDGSWGVADPIVAAVRCGTNQVGQQTYEQCVASHVGPNPEWGCEGLSHGGSQSQTQTQTHTQTQTQGPVNVSFAVEFSPKDFHACVHDFSMGAAQAHAGVHLPAGVNLEDYCRRLFPHDLAGVEKTTLQVDFTLHAESCVDTLTGDIKAADGVVKFESGATAESFCESLFGSASGEGSEDADVTSGQSATETKTSISASVHTSSLNDDHYGQGGEKESGDTR